MDVVKDLVLIHDEKAFKGYNYEECSAGFIEKTDEEINNDYYSTHYLTGTKEKPIKMPVLDLEAGSVTQYIEVYEECKMYYDDTYGGMSYLETEDGTLYDVSLYTPMESHSSEEHPDFFDDFEEENIKTLYKNLVEEFDIVFF